jgi:uncharacterized membrane protein YkoI
VLVSVAVLAVGGSQMAGAKTKSGGGNGETALTGATLDSVTSAVKAAYPGSTVNRASTETDGKATDAYEAKITKADGTKLEVFLDSSFAVTGSKADDRGGREGRGRGRGGRGGNGETAVTGATLDSITSAITAKYPGATVDRASTETDGKSTDAYEAKITKADGTKLEVFLDSSFAVTGEQAQKAKQARK